MRIEAVNESTVSCHRMVNLDIKIGSNTCKKRFQVRDDRVSTLLGRDFLSNKVVTAYDKMPAKPQVLIRHHPKTVCLIETVTVKAGQESLFTHM